MTLLIIGAWMGLLAVLVKVGVFKEWKSWMKLSPIAVWVLTKVFIIIPMLFGAPSGPALIIRNSVEIVSPVTGVVESVAVKAGISVAEGDTLFQVDPKPFEAVVAEINARLDLARTRQGQLAKLIGSGAVSIGEQQKIDADVSALQAQLEEAEWRLGEATVKAPFTGFVPNLFLQPGANVIGSQTAVMAFIDESESLVGVQIEQAHFRNIKIGQPAEVIFKLYPGKVFPAKVTFIVRANPLGQLAPGGTALPEINTDASAFWIGVTLDDDELRLPTGSIGTAAAYTDKHKMGHVVRKLFLRAQNWMNFVGA